MGGAGGKHLQGEVDCRLRGEAAGARGSQGQHWLRLSEGDCVPGGGRTCPTPGLQQLWWSAQGGGLRLPGLLNTGYKSGSCTFLDPVAVCLAVPGISEPQLPWKEPENASAVLGQSLPPYKNP